MDRVAETLRGRFASFGVPIEGLVKINSSSLEEFNVAGHDGASPLLRRGLASTVRSFPDAARIRPSGDRSRPTTLLRTARPHREARDPTGRRSGAADPPVAAGLQRKEPFQSYSRRDLLVTPH